MLDNTAFKDTLALLNGATIDLPAVASFIDDVYRLGVYEEPKLYTRTAKRHVKAMDAKIVELALAAEMFNRDSMYINALMHLARIRREVDGHHWRVERITEEELNARRAA